MAVYVDNARIPYGRMKMSHLVADTPAELHEMADRIGVARRWFQRHASTPHYDVCLAKRELAIELGALPVNRRRMVEVMRRIRAAWFPQ